MTHLLGRSRQHERLGERGRSGQPPCFVSGEHVAAHGAVDVRAAMPLLPARLAAVVDSPSDAGDLDEGTLPIQGPPGSGKTFKVRG